MDTLRNDISHLAADDFAHSSPFSHHFSLSPLQYALIFNQQSHIPVPLSYHIPNPLSYHNLPHNLPTPVRLSRPHPLRILRITARIRRQEPRINSPKLHPLLLQLFGIQAHHHVHSRFAVPVC
jgi:hypothetical protein